MWLFRIFIKHIEVDLCGLLSYCSYIIPNMSSLSVCLATRENTHATSITKSGVSFPQLPQTEVPEFKLWF